MQPQQVTLFNNQNYYSQPQIPSRPTSTNSTSSSLSTASSNARSIQNINHRHLPPVYGNGHSVNPLSSLSSSSSSSSSHHNNSHFQPLFPPQPPPHRNRVTNQLCNMSNMDTCKTTRQHQEDVSKKNLLKFSNCDEQIQASVRLIENSGQKLIQATAKAIACNPGLAEKLSKRNCPSLWAE